MNESLLVVIKIVVIVVGGGDWYWGFSDWWWCWGLGGELGVISSIGVNFFFWIWCFVVINGFIGDDLLFFVLFWVLW